MRPGVEPSTRADRGINGISDAPQHAVGKTAVALFRRRCVGHDDEEVVVAVRAAIAPRDGAEQVDAFRPIRSDEPSDDLRGPRFLFEDGVGHGLSYPTPIQCAACVRHRTVQSVPPMPPEAND